MGQKNVLITSSGNKQVLIDYLKNEFYRIDSDVSIISTDITSNNLSNLIYKNELIELNLEKKCRLITLKETNNNIVAYTKSIDEL
jgi:hypothetical protein